GGVGVGAERFNASTNRCERRRTATSVHEQAVEPWFHGLFVRSYGSGSPIPYPSPRRRIKEDSPPPPVRGGALGALEAAVQLTATPPGVRSITLLKSIRH
ncbi:MAG: hypothetical protein M3008_11905, partial [Chloroflexota bacterium]|nr:hypothetical protein [Chloroflexota bacterium]